MPTYRGVGLNFGIANTVTGVTGAIQTRDHTYLADKELIQNGSGDAVAKVYYNQSEEATFTYVATGSSGGNVAVAKPAIGDLVTITDTNGYNQITGSNWLVDDVSVASSNTSCAKVTVKLSRFTNITS